MTAGDSLITGWALGPILEYLDTIRADAEAEAASQYPDDPARQAVFRMSYLDAGVRDLADAIRNKVKAGDDTPNDET